MGRKRVQKKRKDLLAACLAVWIGVFIALYLLFPGTEGFTGISGDKTWLYYGLSGILLLLSGALFCRDLRRRQLGAPTVAQIAALVFLVCTLISAAFSEVSRGSPWYDPTAHETTLTVFCYVLLFLTVSRWGRPTERLFQVLFWTISCFCLICLLQMLGKNPLGLYPGGLNFYDETAVKRSYAGTIGNVDIVSAFLTLAVPMLLVHTKGQSPRQAWPCWVLAAACAAVLIWIRVLCGVVGLALGGLLCVLVLCPDRWRKLLIGIYAALGLSALGVLWLAEPPDGLFRELHEILHGRISDSYGTGRFYIWRQMLARIPDRLWIGVGPDMARYSGLRPFSRPVAEAMRAVFRGPEGQGLSFWYPMISYRRATLTDAHCYPLHILYCQGLPALLSWLTVVGAVLVHWFKGRRDRAAALLGAGLCCFLCAMLFCFSSVIVMPFFWLTMGLIEARTAELRKECHL